MLEQLIFMTIVTILIVIFLITNATSALLLFTDLTLFRYLSGFVFNALDILYWVNI